MSDIGAIVVSGYDLASLMERMAIALRSEGKTAQEDIDSINLMAYKPEPGRMLLEVSFTGKHDPQTCSECLNGE